MLPFINVFGRELPMYGICMITGAFLAILFACLRAKKKGLYQLDVLLCSLFCFIFGLLGAKLLFIITDIPAMVEHFKTNAFEWHWLLMRIVNSGIVFYGGLLGGFFGGWLYLKVFRLDFWSHADALIPFLPLAHAFGRLGCFCAGCCYGRPLDPPFGWYFPNAIGAPHDVALFPVQLFEATFLLVVLFPLIQIYSARKRKPGQIVGFYLVFYGIFRFFNEYLRYDEIRGIFGGVSTSQWISLALVPIGAVLLSGVFSKHMEPRYATVNGEPEFEPYDDSDDDDSSDAEREFSNACAVCTGCGDCDKAADEQKVAEPEADVQVSDEAEVNEQKSDDEAEADEQTSDSDDADVSSPDEE